MSRKVLVNVGIQILLTFLKAGSSIESENFLLLNLYNSFNFEH